MIAVFFANKLISTDTIVPLMIAVKRQFPTREIRYYCFDAATCAAIRRNVVLWDAIRETGRFFCLAHDRRGLTRIGHRLRVAGQIAWLAIRAQFARTSFVHFKALTRGPFSILAKVNARRTVFAEPNCWGYHKLMIEQVGNLSRARVRDTKAGAGDIVLGFSEDWPELRHPANARKCKIVLPSTHLNADWLDFVWERAPGYFAGERERTGIDPAERILVYILGYFGKFDFLKAPDTMRILLDETLDAIAEMAGDTPVFLKPHAITDLAIVEQAVAARPKGRFVVSHLHPAVLATRAAAFIGNHYSTTFADAAAFGVPTIEYTDYAPSVLAITRNGSMRAEYVTHFINRDPARLRRDLAELLARNVPPRRPSADKNAHAPALRIFAD